MAFCENCGTELINGVCPNCQPAPQAPQAVPQAPRPAAGAPAYQPAQQTSEYSKLFTSPDETPIATLGGRYVRDILWGGSRAKGGAVVSDKRVYFLGKCVSFSGKKRRKANSPPPVELGSITGAGVVQVPKKARIIIFSVLAAFFLVCIVFGVYDLCKDIHRYGYDPFYSGTLVRNVIENFLHGWEGIPIIIALAGFVFFLTSMILLITSVKPKRYLKIEFEGGAIGFDASLYPQKECFDFPTRLIEAKLSQKS